MEKRNSSKLAKRTATQKARARLRKSGESIASRAKAERLAALEARAFQWIARGRAANLELGRVFLRIKAIVGHGQWERYFVERFASCGVAQRTAQTYMEMAREADTKNAESALFPAATDPQALAINYATEKAQAAVAAADELSPETSTPEPDKRTTTLRKKRIRLDGIYRLPLYLTGDQKDNLDALQDSPSWKDAELAIVATVERLFVQYGIVDEIPREEPEAVIKRFPRLPPGKTLETAPIIWRNGKFTKTGRMMVRIYRGDIREPQQTLPI